MKDVSLKDIRARLFREELAVRDVLDPVNVGPQAGSIRASTLR